MSCSSPVTARMMDVMQDTCGCRGVSAWTFRMLMVIGAPYNSCICNIRRVEPVCHRPRSFPMTERSTYGSPGYRPHGYGHRPCPAAHYGNQLAAEAHHRPTTAPGNSQHPPLPRRPNRSVCSNPKEARRSLRIPAIPGSPRTRGHARTACHIMTEPLNYQLVTKSASMKKANRHDRRSSLPKP